MVLRGFLCFSILLVFLGESILCASDPPAELISQHDDIVFDGKKLVHTVIKEIQINSREGDEYGEIEIYYSKLNKVSSVKAEVFDRFGRQVRALKKSDIIDRSAFRSSAYYSDDFVKEFNLRHNTYPYRIRYTYTIQKKQFHYLADWIPVLYYDIPTRDASLSIRVPKDIKLFFKNLNIEKAECREEMNQLIYQWRTKYGGVESLEYYSPSRRDYFPGVMVMPEEFFYEKQGKADSWVHYGDWTFSLFKGMNDLPEVSRERIRKEVHAIESEREKIRYLYNKVQDETRYVNISLKTGGMKPHPASYVDNKKYGDCKALSNYFKTILETIGVNSYLALVQSGNENDRIFEDYPFPQFNHVILMVPIETDTLWIDCTRKTAFGYIPASLQDHRALIIEEGNSHFVTIHGFNSEDVLDERQAYFKAGIYRKTEAEYSTLYRGDDYEYLFRNSRDLSHNVKQLMLRNRYVAPGFDPVDIEVEQPNRDSASIRLNVKATSETMVKQYGDEVYVDVPGCYIPDFEKPEDRFYPVWIPYPETNLRELYFEIPGGHIIHILPEKKKVESRFGSYTIECTNESEDIKVFKRFNLNKGRVELDEYQEFYDFISECKKADNHYIIYKKEDQ